MVPPIRAPLFALAAMLLLVACGDSTTETLVPTSIHLDQETLELEVTETATINAQVFDQHDNLMDPEEAGSITWTSSNQSIASVQNGVVTATGPGEATITATAGGGTVGPAEVSVTVEARELTAQLLFDYAGDRTGSFDVSSTFRLVDGPPFDYALSFFFAAQLGQDFLAYLVREDGTFDHIRFWVDSNVPIESEGTHTIDGGYIIFGWEGEDVFEAAYSGLTDGTLAIEAAEGGRLSGTFSFTVQDQDENELEVTSGTFDLPIVSESEWIGEAASATAPTQGRAPTLR